MARNAATITCGPDDRQELERLAGSRTESKQMIERAQIILGCLAGKRVQEVARTCHTRPNTVIKWRQRFAQRGLAGLVDAPRPGAKPLYGADFRNRVLALLEQPPPAGQACWDGPAVAAALKGSVHAVWRVLRKEGICLQRQRSWCVSTDKEFAAKAAGALVGLDNVNRNPTPAMGSEDFAWMLLKRPGCYIWIGNGDGEGSCMVHNPGYDFNDEILPIGASYWATLVEQQLGRQAVPQAAE